MSLKSVDISYGFNGEPSSASVSFAGKVKSCGNEVLVSEAGSLGEPIITKKDFVDQYLKDFLIISKKTSIDAGFKTISYELVDSMAKKLESIAVLVRGITAAPIGNSLKDLRRLFNCAELGIGIGEYGNSEIEILGKVVVIGKTFSVVSASILLESASVFYHKGEDVGHTPKGEFSNDMKAALRENAKNASLQYGYYLKDLWQLLAMLGYNVVGTPSTSNFMILDHSGSLKEVISSVAAMFGMYWYCRGNTITFLDSKQVSQLKIENFNLSEDPNIISSSYSEDLLGKSSVGVIVGTTDSDGASGGADFGDKTIKVFFGLIPSQEYMKDSRTWLGYFLSIFRLGNFENFFDRIFLSSLIRYAGDTGAKDLSDKALYKSIYKDGTTLAEKTKDNKITLEKLEKDENARTDLGNKHAFLKKLTDLYPLLDENGSGFIRPSGEILKDVVKGMCETFGSIYVSKAVSKTRAESYSVTAKEGFSVTQAYKGATKIKSIPELVPLFTMLSKANGEGGADFESQTLKQLSESVNANSEQVNESESIMDDPYYYLAVKSFLSEGETVEKAVEALNKMNNYDQATNWNKGGIDYFCTNQEDENLIFDVARTSVALSEECLLQAKNREKVTMTAVENKEEKEGTTVEDEDLSIYNSEWKSFTVRSSGSLLSDVSILRFDGNIAEADYLESRFGDLVAPQFNLTTSSVKYFGMKEIPYTPTIQSMSLSFAEGAEEMSIDYSNKEFLSESESVIMGSYTNASKQNIKKQLLAKQKNFLGTN